MPTPTLDAHGIFALTLTVLAFVLFTRDRIPLETSCLLVLTLLVVVFEVFPYERHRRLGAHRQRRTLDVL